MIGSMSAVSQFGSHASNGSFDNSLWHLCLGHMSEKRFGYFQQARLTWKSQGGTFLILWALHLREAASNKIAKGCAHNKGHVGLHIHFDYWGLSRVPSLGGERCFLSIIDDYSKMTWVFMMKQKSKAFNFFKHWTILMKNYTIKTMKYLRTNNDLESCSNEFNEF